ncbi:hypothetical protein Tco_0898887 [Tanacetum coccineum]
MITTTSRIEDKKPSKFILPPMGILGIVPCAKDVDYITQDLAVSSVRVAQQKHGRPISLQVCIVEVFPHLYSIRDLGNSSSKACGLGIK